VAQFLGGAELGLRALSLVAVAERMHRGAAPPADAGMAAGAPLRPATTLREALAEFLARRCEVLPVAGEDGQIGGALHLADLVEPVQRPRPGAE
jgi:osmoprotectant transport system ATP-binding protein